MAKDLFSHPWAAEPWCWCQGHLGILSALLGASSPAAPTPTAVLWDISKAPEEQNKAAASTTRPLAEPVVLQSPLEFNVLYSQ